MELCDWRQSQNWNPKSAISGYFWRVKTKILKCNFRLYSEIKRFWRPNSEIRNTISNFLSIKQRLKPNWLKGALTNIWMGVWLLCAINRSLTSLAMRDQTNSCPSLVLKPCPAVWRLQYVCQLCMASLGRRLLLSVWLYHFHSRLCIQDYAGH